MKNEMNIHEYLSKIGTKGGNAVLKKYGKKHYRDIINKRWEKYRKEKEGGDNITDTPEKPTK